MLMMYLSLVETKEDQSLFETIYYAYRKQMFYVAKGILDDEHLAEDALQEAFLGIAKQITLFRTLSENKTKAYVLTAAKNAAINLGKREQKIVQQQAPFEEAESASLGDQVLQEQMYQETQRILFAEISKLSSVQQDILILKYASELNCAQIAVVLGRKASTVRKELSRARQALKEGCRKEGLEIED